MSTDNIIKAPQTAAFSDGALDVEPGDTVCLTTDEATAIPPGEFVTFYYNTAGIDLVAFELSGADRIKTCSGRAKLIAKKALTVAKIGVDHFSA